MTFAPPTGSSIEQLSAWARRLTDDLNRFVQSPEAYPTFVDDASAAAGNLKVGAPYATPDGSVRRRVS